MIPVEQTPLVLYSEFRAQLTALREHNSSLVFDYESTKGNKDARSHIYKLRQTKAALDRARKNEKAEALERGRQVDAQAKEIAVELDAMIALHQGPIDEIDARETARKAAHEKRIERMQELGTPTNADLPVAKLNDLLAEVESYRPGPHWEEYELEAGRVRDAAIVALTAAIERREKYDAEQAELARHRAAEREREQRERDERIAREAGERAQKAADARAAEERRSLEERAERAERDAADAADRIKRETAEADAKREREAKAREENRRHAGKVHREAVAAFVKAGVDEAAAKHVVTLIAQRAIPRVEIRY